MKKIIFLLFIFLSIFTLGFDTSFFELNDLKKYQKIYKTEDVELCSISSTKTYMDYKMITNTSSAQYKYINEYMEVDKNTGLLLDEEGFIGVALGSYFGSIGDKYYFTLESGVVLPVVKIDAKASIHTDTLGCEQAFDTSVIEFVIDYDYALEYFGKLSNNYILNGNFNNYSIFKGNIVKVEKVKPEKADVEVIYIKGKEKNINYKDIFNTDSGY